GLREDAHVREPRRSVLGGDRADRRTTRQLPAGLHPPGTDQRGLQPRPRTRVSFMAFASPPPQTVVIFGVSGDLAPRTLLPALYDLACEGLPPSRYAILGTGRSPSMTPASASTPAEVSRSSRVTDWTRRAGRRSR